MRESMMIQLICPGVEPPSNSVGQAFRHVSNILSKLYENIATVGAPDSLVGFELRTVLKTMRAGEVDTKCRAILFRPAIEPILLLHGAKVSRPEFNQIDALAIACSLSGKQLSFRSERCFGNSRFGEVEFEPPERVPLWCPAINQIVARKELGLACCAAVFAQTITSHPILDGNGRLARALSQALLLREQSSPLAPVAFAPAFYAKRDELSLALINLCNDGDWNSYYSVFVGVLELAIALGEPVRAEMMRG